MEAKYRPRLQSMPLPPPLPLSRLGGDCVAEDNVDTPTHFLPGNVTEGLLSSPVTITMKNISASQLSPRTLTQALATGESSRATPWLRYSVTLVVGVASLILLVGFLAWSIPSARLQNTIDPLGQSLRTLVMANVERAVQDRWDVMRAHAMACRQRWDIEGQPMNPVEDADRIGQALQPLMQQFPYVAVAPFIVAQGTCAFAATLWHTATLGWRMGLQNCTHHWLERWDEAAFRRSGQLLGFRPMIGLDAAQVQYPMNRTSRTQPFSWVPVYDAGDGLGNVFMANVALFDNASQPIGRAGIGVPVADLSGVLQDQVQTLGGRMVLFDSSLKLIATTHGNATALLITQVGDADLEAVAEAVLSSGYWCPAGSSEISLSRRYFLDAFLISDPYPSVVSLQCCVILLTPQDTTMAAVDQSTYSAVAFVCGMALGSVGVAILLGLMVTRPLQRLTTGMRALKECDFGRARQAAGLRTAWFREMHSALDSYVSLVEAMYAFGKYVPHDIVKGLLAGHVQPELGMTERHVALCFMDMANFTTMCETIPAHEIVNVTSALFDRCCDLILQTHGTIDKFIGDCIMCLWGAPEALDHPEGSALQSIVDILCMLRDHPIYLSTGSALQLRAGLHSGVCLVGNFGASSRWEYTAIGDVVNTASRLEALNKQFHTQCLVSSTIAAGLRQADDYHWLDAHLRPMGDVLLVGKAQAVPVFELRPTPLAPEAVRRWCNALELCSAGRLAEATSHLAAMPDDEGAAALLREVADWPSAGPYVRSMRAK